jgi:hypothetical protein
MVSGTQRCTTRFAALQDEIDHAAPAMVMRTRVNRRLNSFYAEFTSVDAILRALSRV